jgi:hypothetical protein
MQYKKGFTGESGHREFEQKFKRWSKAIEGTGVQTSHEPAYFCCNIHRTSSIEGKCTPNVTRSYLPHVCISQVPVQLGLILFQLLLSELDENLFGGERKKKKNWFVARSAWNRTRTLCCNSLFSR